MLRWVKYSSEKMKLPSGSYSHNMQYRVEVDLEIQLIRTPWLPSLYNADNEGHGIPLALLE